jgi:hypothetical protein
MILVTAFSGRAALADSRIERAVIGRRRTGATRKSSAHATCSRRTMRLAFSAASALLLAACSKSHDLAGTGLRDLDGGINESGAGARTGSSSGGRGGRGGSAGRAGAAARAGSGGNNGTNCDACADPSLLAGLIQATSCCTTSNECGLTSAAMGITDCLPLDAPGTEDATCPSSTVGGVFELPGCCTPGGTCGVLDTIGVGLGCAKLAPGDVVHCTP